MSKFAIVLDIDGVLSDFVANVTDRLGRIRSNGAQPTWGFEDEGADEVFTDWLSIPENWGTAYPIVTQGEVLQLRRFLEEYGVQLYYCTNRNPVSHAATLKWLARYDLPEAPIAYVNDKTEFCRDVEGDGETIIGMLEDSPYNLPDLQAAGFPVYIRDWMYNRHIDGDRVFSVGEFLYRMEKFCDSVLTSIPVREAAAN